MDVSGEDKSKCQMPSPQCVAEGLLHCDLEPTQDQVWVSVLCLLPNSCGIFHELQMFLNSGLGTQSSPPNASRMEFVDSVTWCEGSQALRTMDDPRCAAPDTHPFPLPSSLWVNNLWPQWLIEKTTNKQTNNPNPDELIWYGVCPPAWH